MTKICATWNVSLKAVRRAVWATGLLIVLAVEAQAGDTRPSFGYPAAAMEAGPWQYYAGRSFFVDNDHLGADIDLPAGTPVRAILGGKVVFYGPATGYGELVAVVEHELERPALFFNAYGEWVRAEKLLSIYGHIRSSAEPGGPALKLAVGADVTRGQLLGYVNDSSHPDGGSPDPNGDGLEHLHLGVRVLGRDEAVEHDPSAWFRGYERATEFGREFTDPIALLGPGPFVGEVFCELDSGDEKCVADSLAIVFPAGGSLGGPVCESTALGAGSHVETHVVIGTESAPVQGWSYEVRHDVTALDLVTVEAAGSSLPALQGGIEFTEAVPGGYFQAIVLDIQSRLELPPGKNVVCRALYTPTVDSTFEGTTLRFADREISDPPVAINFAVAGIGKVPHHLYPAIVRRGLVAGVEVWQDNDGDEILDEGETAHADVQAGGTAALMVRVENRAPQAQTYGIGAAELPPGWQATLSPPGEFSIVAGGEATRTMVFHAPVTPSLDEVQLEPTLAVASAPQGTTRKVPLSLRLLPTPTATILAPDDGLHIASDTVDIRWRSLGPTVGRVYYQRLEDGATCDAPGNGELLMVADPILGVDHAVRLEKLPAGTYCWFVEAEIPGFDPPNTRRSEIRQFTLDQGVVFKQPRFRFEIRRNYNQTALVPVENLSDGERHVCFRLIPPVPADLRIGFDQFTAGDGEGDGTDALVLEPGESGRVLLGIHAQDAADDLYTVVAEVRSLGDPPVVHTTVIDIAVRTQNVDFDIEAVVGDHCTLAQTLRITNRGDSLTDLAVAVAAPLDDDAQDARNLVTILPATSHALLPSGEFVEVQAVPTLGPDPGALSDINPVIVEAAAGGAFKTASVDFEPQPGDELFLAEAVSNGLCATGGDWYCTNKPRIVIPLSFSGGFAPTAGGGLLTLTFSPHRRWRHRPHTVKVYLNREDDDHRVYPNGRSLSNVIPSGSYEFDVPAELLALPGGQSATNRVIIRTNHNGGHYVVTSRAVLCVCTEEPTIQRYLFAPSQEEANACLRRLEDIAPNLDDLALALDPIPAARVGDPLTIVARATAAGEPAGGLRVTARIDCTDDSAVIPLRFVDDRYETKWTPTAVGDCTVDVTASACGVSATDAAAVTITANPCEALVTELNRSHHFYANCCAFPANSRTSDDTPKSLARLEDADAWILGSFYPLAAELFDGAERRCSFDANLWYAADQPDPSGVERQEAEFSAAELLASAALTDTKRDPGRALLEDLMDAADGSLEISGATARRADFVCDGDGAPAGTARLRVSPTFPSTSLQELTGAATFQPSDDGLVFDALSDLSETAALARLLPLPAFEVNPFGFAIGVEPSGAVTGTSRAAWRSADSGGAELSAGGVLSFSISADLKARDISSSTDVEPFVLDWVLERLPEALVAAAGRVELSVELAYSSRDLAPDEALVSPLIGGAGEPRVFSGLRGGRPVVVLGASADGSLTAEIHADFADGSDGAATASLPLAFMRSLAVRAGAVNVTGDAELIASGPEGDALPEPAPDVLPITLVARESVGEGGGLFNLIITLPVVLPAVAAGEAERVHQVEINLASKQIEAGEELCLAIPLETLATRFVEAVRDEGRSLGEAEAELGMILDLDQDEVPDPLDSRLDLGGQCGSAIALAVNSESDWQVGEEQMLQACLVLGSGADPSGRMLSFVVDGAPVGNGTTDHRGKATLLYRPTRVGPHRLQVMFSGSKDSLDAEAATDFVVDPRPRGVEILQPAVPWAPPAVVDVVAQVDGEPDTVELRVGAETVLPEPGSETPLYVFRWDASTESPGSVRGLEVVAMFSDGETLRTQRFVRVAAALFQRGNVGIGGTDDQRNISDALLILNFLFAGSPSVLPCDDAADANDDGVVNIADGIFLLNFLFSGGDAPPAPHPFCGHDPSPDSLGCGNGTTETFVYCPGHDE